MQSADGEAPLTYQYQCHSTVILAKAGNSHYIASCMPWRSFFCGGKKYYYVEGVTVTQPV